MKPEELKAIDERAEKAGRIVLALGGSDDLELTLIESVGDIPALLAEVKRLQKIEAAIGAQTRRLIEENDRLRAERDAAKEDIKSETPCKVCNMKRCSTCGGYPDYEKFEWRGMKGE